MIKRIALYSVPSFASESLRVYIKNILGGNPRSMSDIELGGTLTDDRAFAMPLSKLSSR